MSTVLDDAYCYYNPLTHEQTHPTPMIGAWVDWMLAQSVIPQPAGSLLGTIVCMATIIGRYHSFRDLYANTYGICTASSGDGKGDIYRGMTRAMKAVSMSSALGASNIGSGQGMRREMSEMTHRLWINDECHALFARLNKTKSASYDTAIMTNLLTWYNGDEDRGSSIKDGNMQTPINEPYPNFLGMSQPSQLWPELTLDLIMNGGVGRFLFMTTDPKMPTNRAKEKAPPFPDDTLVLKPIEEYLAKACSGGMVARTGVATTKSIEMGCTPEADRVLDQLITDHDKMRFESPTQIFKNVTARWRAHVIKLGMIHAWSLNPMNPVLSVEGLQWGREIADVSVKNVMDGQTIALDNSDHGKLISTIEGYLKSKGEIRSTEMYRRYRGIGEAKFKDIISGLIQNGIIRHEVRAHAGPGRPCGYYIYNQ